MRHLFVSLLLLPFGAANALTIDFDNLTAEQLGPVLCCDFHKIGYSLDIDGFNFSNLGYPGGSSPYGISVWETNHQANADPGGYTYQHSYAQSVTTMTNLDGSSFNVLSIDVTDIFNQDWASYSDPIYGGFYYPTQPGTISLWADLESGGTLSTTFQVDEVQGWQTINLNWTGVTAFYFRNDGSNSNSSFQADNIVVNVVPIPAAVWMFGSAIAALGLYRRKKVAL